MDADRLSKWKALDQIRVAKNCPASWRGMRGGDRVRHCTHCDRKVYNLSNMTRDEAADLIEQAEGRLCVRFYRRTDGMIMTKDCGRAVRLQWRLMSVAAGLLGFVGLALPMFQHTTGVMRTPRSVVRSFQRHIEMYDEMIAEEKDPAEKAKLIAEREQKWRELADYANKLDD